MNNDAISVGVWWEDEAGVELAVLLAESANITFVGVYVHCGNSYGARDPSQVGQIRDVTVGEDREIVSQFS